MTFSTTFNPGMRGADPAAQQADAAHKPKRRGLFGVRVRDSAQTQTEKPAAKTPGPTSSPVFAEAGQRPKGASRGFFSGATKFFTASHPDTVRRRAEAVGEDFARRTERFEQGKANPFLGPFFGMNFTNHGKDRPAPSSSTFSAGSGHNAGPAPFAAGPAPNHSSSGPQFAGPTGPGPTPFAAPPRANFAGYAPPPMHDPAAFERYASKVGNDFARRVNEFSQNTAGPAPFAAGPAQNHSSSGPQFAGPTGPGPTPFAAPPRANFAGYAPPPMHDPAAFERYATNLGNDFAHRVNEFSQNPDYSRNPFEGMGRANYDQPRPAEPVVRGRRVPSASPPAASSQPSTTQPAPGVRIDAARTEYRKMMAHQTAGLDAKKEAAHVMVAKEISVHVGKIDQVGRELDESLNRVDAQATTQRQKLTEKVASMDKMLKELAIQMRPLQRAAFAGGTNSRAAGNLDAETAARSAKNAEISQLRNDIKDQREKTQEALDGLTAHTAGLRSAIMDESERKMSDLNTKIDRAKDLLSTTLNGLDKDFASARSAEMQNISAKHGVKFGADMR